MTWKWIDELPDLISLLKHGQCWFQSGLLCAALLKQTDTAPNLGHLRMGLITHKRMVLLSLYVYSAANCCVLLDMLN